MKAQLTIKGKTIELELTDEQLRQLNGESSGRWKPNENDKFYTLTGRNDVHCFNKCENYYIDKYFDARNCFKTQQEAQAEADRIKLVNKIRDRIEELNGGWRPDFSANKQINYCFRLIEEISISEWLVVRLVESWKYFKSDYVGEQLISEFGDDLKVLFQ